MLAHDVVVDERVADHASYELLERLGLPERRGDDAALALDLLDLEDLGEPVFHLAERRYRSAHPEQGPGEI